MFNIKINEKVFDQIHNLESEQLLFRAVKKEDVNDLFFYSFQCFINKHIATLL